MKKENDRSTSFVVCAIILLVLASVACLACANCMSSNFASIMGGVLSVAATTLLGVIAVWQNRKYKELSDEKSKQAEELMFTPECWLEKISSQEGFAIQRQKVLTDIAGEKCFLHFLTLNLTLIGISVSEMILREKENSKNTSTLRFKGIEYSPSNFPVQQGCNDFEVEITIPDEFLSVNTICRVTLEYKNIYDSVVHKTVEFERTANGHTRITKQERAILIGKNVEDTNHADA